MPALASRPVNCPRLVGQCHKSIGPRNLPFSLCSSFTCYLCTHHSGHLFIHSPSYLVSANYDPSHSPHGLLLAGTPTCLVRGRIIKSNYPSNREDNLPLSSAFLYLHDSAPCLSQWATHSLPTELMGFEPTNLLPLQHLQLPRRRSSAQCIHHSSTGMHATLTQDTAIGGSWMR